MGASGWIAHVKDYMRKHKCTYAEALKKAAPSWRAKKKGGKSKVEEYDVPKKKVRRRRK